MLFCSLCVKHYKVELQQSVGKFPNLNVDVISFMLLQTLKNYLPTCVHMPLVVTHAYTYTDKHTSVSLSQNQSTTGQDILTFS